MKTKEKWKLRVSYELLEVSEMEIAMVFAALIVSLDAYVVWFTLSRSSAPCSASAIRLCLQLIILVPGLKER